jgi:hypothetical protein
MQASRFRCFGFAPSAPDKFPAYPFRSPEPFRYEAVFPHLQQNNAGNRRPSVMHDPVSFLTER